MACKKVGEGGGVDGVRTAGSVKLVKGLGQNEEGGAKSTNPVFFLGRHLLLEGQVVRAELSYSLGRVSIVVQGPKKIVFTI